MREHFNRSHRQGKDTQSREPSVSSKSDLLPLAESPSQQGTKAKGDRLFTSPIPAEFSVALQNVSKSFGTVTALSDVSLSAAKGEVVAIVGPSGCGKTTLLEIACGISTPDSGSAHAEPAVLMPQGDLLFPWFRALDNAALSLRIAGRSPKESREIAQESFATFGLSGFECAYPHELSGGMRQRVAFIRTLLTGKPVLCLDEPFGALDALTRLQMQEWLAATLEQNPHTVLLVTHDVEEAVLLSDKIILLSQRPGTNIATIEIDIEGPRHRSDPAIVELRELALDRLRQNGETLESSSRRSLAP